jgi:ribonucleotide reductase, class II
MSIEALKEYTYISRYARYNKKEKRRETWKEAVDRVKQMHLRKYPALKKEIDWAFTQVLNKRVLSSMRSLQFGGEAIEKINERIYNCTSSYCDRPRFFQEAFFLLLCGAGVGFSVQKHHVAKLPKFSNAANERVCGAKDRSFRRFTVPDSIEGWADALGVLLSSYLDSPEFPEYANCEVIFDYSQIRAKGSRLSSGAGKAPGPEPLRKALENIRNLLDRCISQRYTLRPIDAYDIVMHASDAVLSGGVRRSAALSLFSPDDMEMAKAKTGNWYYDNPQRARSNNSAVLLRDKTTLDQFKELMNSVKEYGEPGFVWADDLEVLFNPCVVGDTIIATDFGLQTAEKLVGKKFNALVDGKLHSTTEKGFWKTGHKDVLRLEFKSGRHLRVTPDHKILTAEGWKKACEITDKDKVIINNQRLFSPNIDNDSSSYAMGYLVGAFIGDGNICNKTAQLKWWGKDREDYRHDGLRLLEQAGWYGQHHKEESHSKAVFSAFSSSKMYTFLEDHKCFDNGKHLSKELSVGTWSYLAGLVGGYFDADGTVSFNPEKGSSLRIYSINLENLRNLQIVLNSFGIYSKIYFERHEAGWRTLPDSNGNMKKYYCQIGHELVISKDSIVRFHDIITLRNKDKSQKLQKIVENYKRIPYRTHFVDYVENIVADGSADVYDCTVPNVDAFDANGVYVHNCVEISMFAYDLLNRSGWQGCNLCEINGRMIKTEEDWAIACKAAAIIGTLQASYTNFKYLGEVSKYIFDREALLGVSITGMMENPDILFDPQMQRKMAELIKRVNFDFANKIGINPAARCTCVKPSGSTSCVLGTSSGIHPHHSKRYFRRVQGNKIEAPLQHFSKYNPLAVEESVWSANKTDAVVTFCVTTNDNVKIKEELSAVDLLNYVKLTQDNWVAAGTRLEYCSQPWLKHNVSNTIQVRENEWAEVAQFIYDNRKYFAGISLLPATGDLDYPQAPFCNVSTPVEIVKEYGDGSIFASGLIVDGLRAFDNNLWKACDAVMSKGTPENWTQEMKDWVRRANQFANRYFNSDTKRMLYCLKEINNWKIWQDLNREWQQVDYTKLVEESDETKLLEELACAGGACQI